MRLTRITNKDCILFGEESETTLDDGNGAFWHGGGSAYLPYTNLLSSRHDRGNVRTLPDNMSGSTCPNWRAVGDVSSIDGHVEFVNRKTANVRRYNIGNLADFPPNVNTDPTFP